MPEEISVSADDIESAVNQAETQQPIVDSVIAAPAVTSQAPVEKKRGRKAYPRTPDGRIIRPDGSTGPKTRTSGKTPTVDEQAWTDEEVGKVLQGVFMGTGLALGSHWRLFSAEQRELGECFGPLFRRYPDAVPDWVKLLSLAPTVVAIVGPRLIVQQMLMKKEIPKAEARTMLLKAVSMMEAEKQLDIARTLEAEKQWLESKVKATALASRMMELDPNMAAAMANLQKQGNGQS